MVECVAPNKCFISEFNAKDYYCIEYKSLNEMSRYQQDKFRNNIQKDKQAKEFKQWALKFHTRTEAKKLIKKYKENNR